MIKKILKRLFYFLLIAFIIIQFFRPQKNTATGDMAYAKDISTIHHVPDTIKGILQKACNDCHSNNTAYPWYNNIQPVAWWLKNHIDDGKKHLNFSEFARYSLRRQYKKLEEVNNEVKDGGMPLSSYTLIHKNAILTDAEKQALASWTNTIRDSMKAVYPEDSLKLPPKKA
jgi:Haem-binding domain